MVGNLEWMKCCCNMWLSKLIALNLRVWRIFDRLRQWLCVEGADDTATATVEDVGVDHGGFDIAVTEKFLNGADVVAAL